MYARSHQRALQLIFAALRDSSINSRCAVDRWVVDGLNDRPSVSSINQQSIASSPRFRKPNNTKTLSPAMAAINGTNANASATLLDPSSNLGKRKRLPEESDGQQHGRILQNQSASLQNSMRSTLDSLRTYVLLSSTSMGPSLTLHLAMTLHLPSSNTHFLRRPLIGPNRNARGYQT